MQSHVLDFWFKELEPRQWWEKNHQLDLMIQTRFGTLHQQAIKLFEALGNANSLEFERKHKVIIDRFVRYPHRNRILGRISTDEEIAFLKEPDSSF